MSTIEVAWICAVVMVALVSAISVVDINSLTIPNSLNFGLAAVGLGYQTFVQQAFPFWTVVASIGLMSVLYSVRQVFLYRNGIDGLGLGDVKLAGASALWLHPANLPLFVLIASSTALLSLPLLRRTNTPLPDSGKLPFGPFLGIGLIACWLLETFWNFDLLATNSWS